MSALDPELQDLYRRLDERLEDVSERVVVEIIDGLERSGIVHLGIAMLDVIARPDGDVTFVPKDPWTSGAALMEAEILIALPRALELIELLTGRRATATTRVGPDLGFGPQIGGAEWVVRLASETEGVA